MTLPCFNIKAHIQMSGYDIHLRMLHILCMFVTGKLRKECNLLELSVG